MEAVELHVATDSPFETIAKLKAFCEEQEPELQVIRAFWRGVEPDDEVRDAM